VAATEAYQSCACKESFKQEGTAPKNQHKGEDKGGKQTADILQGQ
jgi:hypothetical protein